LALISPILLVVGGKYHPFMECAALLKSFVEASGGYSVTVTEDWDALKAERIHAFEAVVAYSQGGAPTDEQLAGLLGYVRDGGSFIGLHGASATWKECAPFHEMLGSRFAGHGPVSEFAVKIVDSESPIVRNIDEFRIEDELYVLGDFDPVVSRALATAELNGETHVVAYTKTYGAGRVYYLSLGHDERAFNHPSFRALVLGGLDWAAQTTRPANRPAE